MKKGIIVLICLLCSFVSFAQVQMEGRVLTWSIGKVKVDRGQPLKVVYPLLVSISDSRQQPQLGTSTIRFFYDAGYLNGLQLERIANNYVISGLNQSNNVFGEAFGFPGGGGVFAQFNLLVNESNPLPLSTEPVHVLDITFRVKPGAGMPSCIPLVLDNHPAGWGSGANLDSGYLQNEGGISGSYYLDGMLEEVFLGDDEVRNYLWEHRVDLFRNKLEKKGDQVGEQSSSKAVFIASGCIEVMEEIKKVRVMDFQATGQGADCVLLNWSTISEFDNDRFEVQRSADGIAFQAIGMVKGHWNTLEKTEYGFLDDQAHPGNLYYRLQQVSGSGEISFSEVRMVRLYSHEKADRGIELSCSPNPTSGIVNVSYRITDSTVPNTSFELLVFDAAGQFVLRKKEVPSYFLLDLSEFQAGVYQVAIQNSKQKIESIQRIILTPN